MWVYVVLAAVRVVVQGLVQDIDRELATHDSPPHVRAWLWLLSSCGAGNDFAEVCHMTLLSARLVRLGARLW